MRRKISQAGAHRLQSQVARLQNKIDNLERSIRMWRNWNDIPDATEIATLVGVDIGHQWAISTAQKLGHTVIARYRDNKVVLVSLPSPELPR